MASFVAIIHKEPGSAYGVSFPDFPGCVSAGDDLDTALRSAQEALGLHIEGMVEDGEPLPDKPRSIDEVMADPAFADGMPALVSLDLPGRSVRLNISLDEALVRRIDRTAAARGMTRSAFLAEAARAALARR
jgi:predicted RNase H-like HicB family nuclease